MTVTFIGQKEINPWDLTPHPENPNQGDVNAIAESLEQFGQYRSVVATTDNVILAGHHVVQAAKNIGMKLLRVDVVDADENSARRILLADNRLADLGPGPDMERLLEVLMNIDGEFPGTGYDDHYLQMLEETLTGAPSLDDLEKEAGGPPEGDDFMQRVVLVVDSETMLVWQEYRKGFESDNEAFGSLLELRSSVA